MGEISDVAVVGAGPAGVSAACILAGRGCSKGEDTPDRRTSSKEGSSGCSEPEPVERHGSPSQPPEWVIRARALPPGE